MTLSGVDARPTTLVHPSLLSEVHRGRVPNVRKLFQIYGMSPPLEYIVHNSSLCNLTRAIMERVYYVKNSLGEYSRPPMPKPGVFRERLAWFRSHLVRKIGYITPMGRESFPLLYQGRKRTIYTNAVESLQTKEVCRGDARLKAFVKAEKINATSKRDPVPRVIQPRDPRYNVEVGRFIRPLEHKIYQAVASIYGETTVFKNINAHDSGRLLWKKWSKFTNPVAIGLDASRFDQHVSREALQWEHSCYLRCYRDSSELARLLEWQIANKGVGHTRDGRLRYSVDGCRMSGDMNTALGNCLLMCAMVHSFCTDKQVGKFELANNGDDCVLIMEVDKLGVVADLPQYFLDFGFTMKVEKPVFQFEHIEFCQAKPIHVGFHGPDNQIPDYLMVRGVPTSLAKDAVSIKPLDSRKAYEKQCTALGECGMALTGGLPICQEFNQCLIRAGRDQRFNREDQMDTSGKLMMASGMTRHYSEIAQYTRFSFYLAFGILPDQQENIEAYYRGFTPWWSDDKSDQRSVLPPWF